MDNWRYRISEERAESREPGRIEQMSRSREDPKK
jgi:hypothetical protein